MNTVFRKKMIAFTLLLCALTANTMNINARGYDDNDKCSSGLHITGRAEKTVKSDRAVLQLTLSVSGDCYKEMIQKIDHQIEELKTIWIGMDVKPNMIHVDNRKRIRISDLEYGSDKKQNKFSIQYTIVVTMDNLDMVPAVQNTTNTLVEKGFVFSEQSVSYLYSGVAELQKELTKEALKDAEKTATENARVLGLSIEKTPNSVQQSTLSCCSTDDNPKPYENGWNSSTEIENKFSVLVDMNYSFKNDGKNPSSEQ